MSFDYVLVRRLSLDRRQQSLSFDLVVSVDLVLTVYTSPSLSFKSFSVDLVLVRGLSLVRRHQSMSYVSVHVLRLSPCFSTQSLSVDLVLVRRH